jgi:ferredoxin
MEPVLLIIVIVTVLALILFLPIRGARSFQYVPPSKRFHEAHAVLSRRLLNPGTGAYDAFYREHPQWKEADDRSRQSPGLLSGQSKYHHPETFAASRANFEVIDFLGHLVHGPPVDMPGHSTVTSPGSGKDKTAIPDPERAVNFITRWLRKTGAHSVGFTPLKETHLYSHKGRGALSGEPIEHRHTNAIAITVEMDHEMMQPAPRGSSVMESSEQYLRSGVLALKLAAFIREMGYEATAHIDGNYEVVCPLVAVDAGLGVIGRMGLLMTPDLGPRVRISAVTTTMPLVPSGSKPDLTTIHFCHLCKKCAVNCPAAAIPEGPMQEIDDTRRWQINSEKCYHFWTTSGTDCGRCMSVCPYSHLDSIFHRFIRWGIKNNLVFRRLALKLDDVFYGRKPSIRPLPGWADMMDKP